MSKEYINRLGKERREQILQTINLEVIVRESYLLPRYSAKMLCEKYGYAQRDVSAVMGLYFGENFSSLIQRLRVNKACKMMANPAMSHHSCEWIGVKCGFASRQSLYNAFAKVKGTTPSEYRDSIMALKN